MKINNGGNNKQDTGKTWEWEVNTGSQHRNNGKCRFNLKVHTRGYQHWDHDKLSWYHLKKKCFW